MNPIHKRDWAGAVLVAALLAAPARAVMHPVMMPMPGMPIAMSCQAPDLNMHTDPQAARPMGITVMNGMMTMTLGFSGFMGSVDIYVMAQMADGQHLFLNGMGQWMPNPPNVVPWRANSADPVNAQVFQMPTSAIAPAMYYAYMVVVPAGMDPAMFDLSNSPYYQWCFNRMFP